MRFTLLAVILAVVLLGCDSQAKVELPLGLKGTWVWTDTLAFTDGPVPRVPGQFRNDDWYYIHWWEMWDTLRVEHVDGSEMSGVLCISYAFTDTTWTLGAVDHTQFYDGLDVRYIRGHSVDENALRIEFVDYASWGYDVVDWARTGLNEYEGVNAAIAGDMLTLRWSTEEETTPEGSVHTGYDQVYRRLP